MKCRKTITKHYDELHWLLYSTKIPFDIIGITETKQSLGKEFLLNVNINKYQLHSQPTKVHVVVLQFMSKNHWITRFCMNPML